MHGKSIGIIVLAAMCLLSCKRAATTQEAGDWSDLQVKTTNKELFAKERQANIEGWNAALEFLTTNDLKTLAVGRYELSPDGTYATVSIYETKEPETAKYEAHRKFIDIQYVAVGEEYIEIIPLNKLEKGQAYDPEADILFFDDETAGHKLYANEDTYFIFFPEDAHKPCLKIDTVKEVKKIVVKIPISE